MKVYVLFVSGDVSGVFVINQEKLLQQKSLVKFRILEMELQKYTAV